MIQLNYPNNIAYNFPQIFPAFVQVILFCLIVYKLKLFMLEDCCYSLLKQFRNTEMHLFSTDMIYVELQTYKCRRNYFKARVFRLSKCISVRSICYRTVQSYSEFLYIRMQQCIASLRALNVVIVSLEAAGLKVAPLFWKKIHHTGILTFYSRINSHCQAL